MDACIYKNYSTLRLSFIWPRPKKFWNMQQVVGKPLKENSSSPLWIIKLLCIKRPGNFKKPKVIFKPSSTISLLFLKTAPITSTQIKIYHSLKVSLTKVPPNIKISAFLCGEKRVWWYFTCSIVPSTLKIKTMNEPSLQPQKQSPWLNRFLWICTDMKNSWGKVKAILMRMNWDSMLAVPKASFTS